MYEKITLAPTGSSGNNTHAGVPVEAYDSIAVEFIVESVGGTPTVTWKVQASLNDPSTGDGAATDWYDLGYVTDATDTVSQATRTTTAVGKQIVFLSNPVARKYRRFRVVTTSNTNVVYRAELTRVR